MALTASQEHILRVFASLENSSSFALVGGGAMNVHGIIDRPTDDLDFFTPEIRQITAVADALSTAMTSEGAVVKRIRQLDGFVQLEITNGITTRVDLAHDYRWLDPIQTDLGLVLDSRELAADKLCAMFNRAAIRDMLDVAALSQWFSMADMVSWAKEKDTGFDIGVTIEMITSRKPDLAGYGLSLPDFEQIRIGLLRDLSLVAHQQQPPD